METQHSSDLRFRRISFIAVAVVAALLASGTGIGSARRASAINIPSATRVLSAHTGPLVEAHEPEKARQAEAARKAELVRFAAVAEHIRQTEQTRQAKIAAYVAAVEAHEAEKARQAEAARVEQARRDEVARKAEAARVEQERKAEQARIEQAEAAAQRTAPAPAPAAPATAGGSTWDALAQCESGGNWQINTGNGYYGGLQFSASSWRAVGGTGLPHQHSREHQIAMGERLKAQGGWGHWPACSRKLGLR